MGQHSLCIKSTTGHLFNFICNCLALLCSILFSHSFFWRRKVYFMDLASLKRRDWKRFNTSRAWLSKVAKNGAKESHVRNGNFSWRTGCSWAHPKALQAEQGGFWESVTGWCMVGSADGVVQPSAWLRWTSRAQNMELAFCWVSVFSQSVIFCSFQSHLWVEATLKPYCPLHLYSSIALSTEVN